MTDMAAAPSGHDHGGPGPCAACVREIGQAAAQIPAVVLDAAGQPVTPGPQRAGVRAGVADMRAGLAVLLRGLDQAATVDRCGVALLVILAGIILAAIIAALS